MNSVRPINSITNEMDKFLERHTLQKLIQEETENLNGLKSTKEINYNLEPSYIENTRPRRSHC